ncbi:hypothetical protein BVRB_9g219320 [Beta vulgaris subsp. vulgaris]|nr:hypothetical protein BVRB_9g219320 [Beta vulgaris subsp. vulgaris]
MSLILAAQFAVIVLHKLNLLYTSIYFLPMQPSSVDHKS